MKHLLENVLNATLAPLINNHGDAVHGIATSGLTHTVFYMVAPVAVLILIGG